MEIWIQILIASLAIYFLLWVVEVIIHKRMNADLVRIRSKNLAEFYVKDLPNKHEAAELLASTRNKLFKVVDRLRSTPDSEIPSQLVSGVRRIVMKHCHRLNINELDATKYATVAMNRKKGQEIHICIRECPNCVDLTSEDRLLIVALHELAHSGTKNYDPNVNGVTNHGDEFKRYEHYIIQIAQQMNLLNSANVIGKNICGVIIPSITNPA